MYIYFYKNVYMHAIVETASQYLHNRHPDMCTNIHKYICIHKFLFIYVYIYVYIQIYIHIYIYAYTCKYKYIYIHMHI